MSERALHLHDPARRLRLASDLGSVRAGAHWELWLEARLRAAGADLQRHPSVAGLTRRPDLRAEFDGSVAYIEATATGGGSVVGHRQLTPGERLNDVLMSRLKQKSRAFQGIDGPLLVAVLCVSRHVDERVVHRAVGELFDHGNERGRNVSAVLAGWQLDAGGAPTRLELLRHPHAGFPLPDWLDRLGTQ